MLTIKNLTKYYKNQKVLNNINCTIKKGESISLVGPSGHGKTTMLRCIQGLEEYEGEITLNGTTGFVFQHFYLFPHMTVLENLTYALEKVKKISPEIANKNAHNILKKLHIEDKVNHYPGTLSGGQKQRVAIARTLLMEPKVLLLDEPTSALDPEISQELAKILRDYQRKGHTIIFVSHDTEFEKTLSDRKLTLKYGKLT